MINHVTQRNKTKHLIWVFGVELNHFGFGSVFLEVVPSALVDEKCFFEYFGGVIEDFGGHLLRKFVILIQLVASLF